jgi:glycosyltransferase involved in cell wall biosynthesis/SAM-dependent methyltransferase
MTPPTGSTVGILPALGSGLTDLRRSGQHARLLGYDLRHYCEAFDRVYYFSYFDERLEDFTDDPQLRARVVVVPNHRRWPRRLYALLLPWLQRRRLRECSVLRVMQLTGAVPALLARALLGVPFVVTYGYHYAALARLAGSRVKPVLYGLLERLALRGAAAILVTSPELERHVRARGASVVGLYPNGVDVEAFHPGAPAPDPPIVLYVGRLEPEKNLARLVEALATVPARLAVIGEGSLRGALERQARATGVEAEFLGTVPHDALPARFAAARVFVLPSLSEGHPKALIEAMACGLPCAASARGGIPSLLEDGVTGLLFDPEDACAIAAAVRRLLDDHSLAARLGAAARAVAAARYDAHRLLAAEARFVRVAGRGDRGAQIFDEYAETIGSDHVLPEFVVGKITAEVRRRQLRRALDVGSGDGRWVELVGRTLGPDAFVVGVEISPLRARRMRARGLRAVVARSEALPFRAGAFDFVTLIEVIEHTTSPERTLDEVRRVLGAGGRLVLTTPNYPMKRLYDARAALRARSLRRLRDDPTHFSPLSAGRLERLLAGRFESIRVEGTAILGEGRSRWLRGLKTSALGRRLANKLFAVCARGPVTP